MQDGRDLAELHINYEKITPYPLPKVVALGAPEDAYERYTVGKLKYAGRTCSWDTTQIRYNVFLDIEGIPEDAQRYMLGSRSGPDWIVERYRVKTGKASGIINDPNDWSRELCEPQYIIDLIGRITTLSVETLRIIDGLPDLELSK